MKRARRRVVVWAACVLVAFAAEWLLGRAVAGADVIAALVSAKPLAPLAVVVVFALRVFLMVGAPAWGVSVVVGAAWRAWSERK